jgi:hypothetical protein
MLAQIAALIPSIHTPTRSSRPRQCVLEMR